MSDQQPLTIHVDPEHYSAVQDVICILAREGHLQGVFGIDPTPPETTYDDIASTDAALAIHRIDIDALTQRITNLETHTGLTVLQRPNDTEERNDQPAWLNGTFRNGITPPPGCHLTEKTPTHGTATWILRCEWCGELLNIWQTNAPSQRDLNAYRGCNTHDRHRTP